MNKKKSFLYSLFIILLISCTKEDPNPPVIDNQSIMSEFAFLRQHNPGLTMDVFLENQDEGFTGELPEGARINEMVASYDLKEGYEAFVEGVNQIPGETANDFSNIVNFLVVGPDADSSWYTVDVEFIADLPVIHLYTDSGQPVVSKEEYTTGSIRIDGMDLFPDLDNSDLKIRGRGHSTWGLHPKKPYQIKFDDKMLVLGMPEDKRWVLLAEYSDKTFLRNRTAFEMAYLSELEWTPQCEYADVYINGEYQGLYLVTQKVEESKNRLDITDDGYLLEIDDQSHVDENDVYFHSDHFLINVKEPEIDASGPELQYIKDYIDDFEDALFGPYFKHPQNGYRKYIDMQSVAEWFLINEIAKNVDARWFSSIYFYLAPGDKIKMGPVWDFDLGFGNVDYADSEYPEGWWVRQNPWINRMLEDPAFASLVKERYAYFRALQPTLFEFMDEEAKYIHRSMQANDDKWHTIGMYVWPNPEVYSTYEQELDHLKSWINQRLLWMDGAVSQL